MRISDWSSDVCSSDLTRLAGFTADGYNSIEFHHAGGDTFKIGDFGAVVQTENPVNFNVPVTIVDGDGDTAPGSLAITTAPRSEEHTSELQSLMRISYAVFCLKRKNTRTRHKHS